MSQQLLGATSPVTSFHLEEDVVSDLYYSTGMKWAHAKGGVMPILSHRKLLAEVADFLCTW